MEMGRTRQTWDKFKQEQLRSMEDERRFDAREDRRQLIRQVPHRLAKGIELANIPEMDEAVARRHLDTLVRAFNTANRRRPHGNGRKPALLKPPAKLT